MDDYFKSACERARKYLSPPEPVTGCILWGGVGSEDTFRYTTQIRKDVVRLNRHRPHLRFSYKGQLIKPQTLFYAEAAGVPLESVPALTQTCQNWRCCNVQHSSPTGKKKPPRGPQKPVAAPTRPTVRQIKAVVDAWAAVGPLNQEQVDAIIDGTTPHTPPSLSYEEVLPTLLELGPTPDCTAEMINGWAGVNITINQDHLERYFNENQGA